MGHNLDQSIMLWWVSDWIIQKRGQRGKKKIFKNKLITATYKSFSKIRSSLNQDSIHHSKLIDDIQLAGYESQGSNTMVSHLK